MGSGQNTAISRFFAYVYNEDFAQAKSILTDVNREIKLLLNENLGQSASNAVRKLEGLIQNVDIKQRQCIATGKRQDVYDAYDKHLHILLTDILAKERGVLKLSAKNEPIQDQETDVRRNQSQLEKSKNAALRLKEGNPDIVDLCDSNRPTKIAEKFSELYDNEWTEAYEAMTEAKRRKDMANDVIQDLLKIVEGAYRACTKEYQNKKKNDMVDNKVTIQTLQRTFSDQCFGQIIKGHLKLEEIAAVEKYTKKCVELCWWMSIRNPPVYMYMIPPDQFDANLYRAYTKSGTDPAFVVWPALKLYKEGGVLAKGVVQYK